MSSRALIIAVSLGLTGCSSGVPFIVELDEPATSGKLTLNGQASDMTVETARRLAGVWTGSDAGGSLTVTLEDGTQVRCPVGYVTHGLDAQRFAIHHRTCRQL